MKIALLGGSFDPPHQGHLYIARAAIEKLDLGEVWMIPTKQNPLKNETLFDYDLRLKACEEITKDQPQIIVKDLQELGNSTYDLVKDIKETRQNDEFFWLMGQDNLQNFHLWHNYQELMKMIPFVIFPRKTENEQNQTPKFLQEYNGEKTKDGLPKFIFMKVTPVDISSSDLRKGLKS